MGIPEGSFAIAAFVIIALPGFIYAAVCRWFRGESAADRDVPLTIARGAIFAVAMTAAYLATFGNDLFASIRPGSQADSLTITHPGDLGRAVLLLYVVVPVLVSFILNLRHVGWYYPKLLIGKDGEPFKAFRWLRLPRSRHGYSSIPSAWDHAASQNHNAWVKVKRANGDWVGGWYTKGSFITTYPEPRSIYIAHQHTMKADGSIDAPIPQTGVFLSIGDDDIVIWENPTREED